MDNDQLQILISGILDIQKTQANINSQVKQIKTDVIKVGVDVDTKDLQKVKNDIDDITSQKKIYSNNLDVLIAKTTSSAKNLEEQLQKVNENFSNISNAQQLKDQLNEQINVAKILENQAKKTKDSLQDIDSPQGMMDWKRTYAELNSEANKFNSKQKLITNEIKAQNQATQASQKLESQRLIASNKLIDWMNKNTKAAKVYKEQLEALKIQLSKVSNEEEMKKFNDEMLRIMNTAKIEGNEGKTWFNTFEKSLSTITRWITLSGTLIHALNVFKQMITVVSELDKAMVDLKKVTEETDSTYTKFLKEANTQAYRLGTTTRDMVTSTAEFARLGYTLKEASQMAHDALLYKNVGDDITIEEATQSLISTQKAYGLSVENNISIVDKFNEVGNRFAISSKGIGDALQRSASSLSAANNTLDQSIGLIVAANNVVQDPEVVGRLCPAA